LLPEALKFDEQNGMVTPPHCILKRRAINKICGYAGMARFQLDRVQTGGVACVFLTAK
jgi:hypothetical protein